MNVIERNRSEINSRAAEACSAETARAGQAHEALHLPVGKGGASHRATDDAEEEASKGTLILRLETGLCGE